MIQLQLETVAYCNAACVFCPYPTMTRQRGVMPWPLFERIVEEAAGVDKITQYTLTGLGEPLLDPMLVDRIRFIRMKDPTARVDVFTNGSFLTREKAVELGEAGLTELFVSLNAANADKRYQVMRLDDYDKVVQQIKDAIALAKYRVTVKAVWSKDLMEADEADEFSKQWGGPTAFGGNAFVHLEGNWAGETYKLRVKPSSCCNRALTQIMVLWDGRVSLCCFDGEGEVILGDLRAQTIREVFAGELAVGIRQAHMEGRRGELKLCKDCTAI